MRNTQVVYDESNDKLWVGIQAAKPSQADPPPLAFYIPSSEDDKLIIGRIVLVILSISPNGFVACR